ncbi:MAG: DUF5671 domain-containing protein [Candidatus Nealsonbacteria bacterium]
MENSNNNSSISPKNVFLHLFVIIMLYIATANFLTLIFQYINILIPDTLSNINYYSHNQYVDLIRFALASILVIFPVFILSSWFLNKLYLKNPAIREMRLRKWLIYFTLFVASLIIVGDLVKIILVFLEGEITTRFILKAFSMLIIALLIFGYYLWEVKRKNPAPRLKYFVWTIIIIVAITIISGFFFIGSPKQERLRKLDQERINNLQNIQSQIINYWQKKEKLPENLSNLNDEISGFKVPTDPETGQNYEYNTKGDLSFELCAIFNLEGDNNTDSRMIEPAVIIAKSNQENWKHNAGKECFERTIDKELYSPENFLKKNIESPEFQN